MKKIVWGVVVVALFAILILLFCFLNETNNKIFATRVEVNDAGIEEATSSMEITYENGKLYKMVLRVSCPDKEFAEVSYDSVKQMFEAIKSDNPNDLSTLERKESGFILTTYASSKAFAYEQDITMKEMKEFLIQEGWKLKYQ